MLILRIFMAVCLYVFIGLIIYVIWKDLSHQSALAVRKDLPFLTLHTIKPAEIRVFTIQKSEGFIGRDPGCNIHIDENTLSARHAKLSYHHNQWWVEDLNSTNGSLLNDHPLVQPSVLDSGDKLFCGQVGLTIEINQSD